ncbi:MAG: glutamine cyclotransferase [Bacteroidetes bacterium]|nr:MAG: glutamine cyclotransferase [Bacteroidota bacterium]REK00804.1 MAG: glutamine cyclotransferase [Bacteroidota bacterium]REK35297.1 MAG: glutamine cyclotransferase [Bacteroidota bacterium]REK48377.1 MAG: glutamine cyclotransferase [Bacteroidota bacterium]
MKFVAFITMAAIAVTFNSCGSESGKKDVQTNSQAESHQQVLVPEFNADSAYVYIQQQVDFGPRVPNSKAHAQCADFLLSYFQKLTPHVQIQNGQVQTYDKTKINLKNIIASFSPEKSRRILLFAHWDTRPWADQDPTDQSKPNLGADDGGSGVGVLMEIARHISVSEPLFGIDIILFDAEDWGKKGGGHESEDSYCLGAQYWVKNPHLPSYSADYGILLDLVGGKNSQFRLEGHSMNYASFLQQKIWKTAVNIGYSDYFLFQQGGYVIDDHYYVNQAGIPSVNIIASSATTANGFPKHWHTHEDNMDVIDRKTLKAVGQTVLHVIYREGSI